MTNTILYLTAPDTTQIGRRMARRMAAINETPSERYRRFAVWLATFVLAISALASGIILAVL